MPEECCKSNFNERRDNIHNVSKKSSFNKDKIDDNLKSHLIDNLTKTEVISDYLPYQVNNKRRKKKRNGIPK